MKRRNVLAAIAAMTLMLAGCTQEGDGMNVPTGDELVAQAEQHYLSYRGVTNALQAVIFDGPWQTDIASFGMQPSGAGCPDDAFKFDLTRTTTVEPEALDGLMDDARAHLVDAGFDVEVKELGSGAARSTDLIVRDQGDFSLLMVTFIANGKVLVTATTTCWPGDRNELSDALFGGVTLGEGYLPREDSPSDPLFFGVTPGEPGFLPTPTPTRTSTPMP